MLLKTFQIQPAGKLLYTDTGLSEKDYLGNEDFIANSLQSGFEGTFSNVKRKDSKKQTIDGKTGFGYSFEGKLDGTLLFWYMTISFM